MFDKNTRQMNDLRPLNYRNEKKGKYFYLGCYVINGLPNEIVQ